MKDSLYTLEKRQTVFEALREVKEAFAARGWFPATSGNLSARIGRGDNATLAFAVTASGKDKSVHTAEDFIVVDQNGKPMEPTQLKPSAETLIHCEIYKTTGCGAVFHVHTVFNNLVSEQFWEQRKIPIEGIELIKGLGIWEEDAKIEVPILPNYADIAKIASLVKNAILPQIPGIVLRKHGIYAWGNDVFEAKRHLEAFEFLFEYVIRRMSLSGS